MTLSQPLGITARFNRALAGTPDHLLTALLIAAALAIAYLAWTLPPSAKVALLAYIALP